MVMPAAPVPVCTAILICERAIQEEGSHKNSLIGIFENVRIVPPKEGVPSPMPGPIPVAVYANLTGAEGDYELRLELANLNDNVVFAEGKVNVSIADRMRTFELVFNLGLVSFLKVGKYEVRLYANDKYLSAKSFNVVDKNQEDKP